MAKFKVETIDSGVVSKIRAMAAAGQDLKPLHERIASSLLPMVQIGFKQSRSPYGNAWAPLKIRQGQPLRNTGRLRNSITPVVASDGVTIGTNLKYAAIHQFGGVIKAKGGGFLMFPIGGGRFARKRQVTIPARPFMPLDPDGNVDLPKAYQATVISRIRAHFKIAADGA